MPKFRAVPFVWNGNVWRRGFARKQRHGVPRPRVSSGGAATAASAGETGHEKGRTRSADRPPGHRWRRPSCARCCRRPACERACGRPSRTGACRHLRLRPQCPGVRSVHDRDSGPDRCRLQEAGTQPVWRGPVCLSLQAGEVQPRRPGGVLHAGGGPGADPRRRRHHRRGAGQGRLDGRQRHLQLLAERREPLRHPDRGPRRRHRGRSRRARPCAARTSKAP